MLAIATTIFLYIAQPMPHFNHLQQTPTPVLRLHPTLPLPLVTIGRVAPSYLLLRYLHALPPYLHNIKASQ